MALQFQETHILGDATTFATVRHLVLRGTNREIGKKLGELARDRYGVRLLSSPPTITHARRNYFAHNYPLHLERSCGVADAFNIHVEDESSDPMILLYNLDMDLGIGGCSVVFYPPSTTTTGHGMLSRNYDFPTGGMRQVLGLPLPAGVKPVAMTAEPYILELHPERGYASLSLTSYDLLGSALDGINEKGLMVSLMADNEAEAQHSLEPTRRPSVGIYELQIVRLLLDTCATVEEAKQVLLQNKHYYMIRPCHYIVADRSGHSFVWEYSHMHNAEYMSDGNGKPQVVTNHPLYRYPTQAALPSHLDTTSEASASHTYNRYRALAERIEHASPNYSLAFLKETNACVFVDDALIGSPRQSQTAEMAPPARTLWHGIYDATELSLDISFYLREEPHPEGTGPSTAIRSEYKRFTLTPDEETCHSASC